MIRPRDILPALLAVIAVLALAAAVPWLRFVLTIIMAKTLGALGVMLLLRAGQVSFGQSLYVAISAYAVAFLAPAIPEVLLLVPLAMMVAMAAAVVIGVFVTRYREIFFSMLNLAMSMVFYSLLEKLYGITRGTDGIRIAPTRLAGMAMTPDTQSWAALVLGIVLVAVFSLVVRAYLAAPMGQALAGIKTRETRLEFMGVPARRVLLAAYVLAALMAGSGGAVLALATRQVTPALAYWTASGELVFIVVLGGAGSVLGPLLGAAAYEFTRVYAAAQMASAWQLILGVMMLCVIMVVPGGVVSILGSALRRIAKPGEAA